MTALNAVRFRVKPGRDQNVLDAHRNVARNWTSLNKVNMIKTGDSRMGGYGRHGGCAPKHDRDFGHFPRHT